MPFRSNFVLSNYDNPQAVSLTGLSYKSGTGSMSAPCLNSRPVDDGDNRGYVCDTEVAKTSWPPLKTEVNDRNKSSPKSLSNFMHVGRSKAYSLKPLPTVLETVPLDNVITPQSNLETTDSTTAAVCSEENVDPMTEGKASTSPYILYMYAEGDEGGVVVGTQMEENNMECMDYHRDGCCGQPETAQIGQLMEEAIWIVLYISDIRCDHFHLVQQMAIGIARDSKRKKIVNLLSSTQIKIPPELKLFHVIIIEEEDWLLQLKSVVRQEPEDFTGQAMCSLKNCPLSGSSQSIQSDCVDVVHRLSELGKSGVSLQAKKYARQKQIWDAK